MIENITFSVTMKMTLSVEYDENDRRLDVLNHIAPFVDEMVYNYKSCKLEKSKCFDGIRFEPDFMIKMDLALEKYCK